MRQLFFIAATVAFCACSGSPDKKQSKQADENRETIEATILKEGDSAPDFKFTTINGEEHQLSDFKGKTVFINFFAQACPLCIKELPVLESKIYNKYKNREDFVLIAIGREHSSDQLKQFVKKYNVNMPVAPDVDRSRYSLFATKFIPRNILINKEGKIVMHKVGYSEEEFNEVIKIVEQEIK